MNIIIDAEGLAMEKQIGFEKINASRERQLKEIQLTNENEQLVKKLGVKWSTAMHNDE